MAASDPDTRSALAAVDLFASLSPRQLTKLAAVAKTTTHRSGAEVASQGRGSLAFHAIVDGHADVSVNGRRLRTLGPGDYFGEISLIDGEPRSATVSVADGETLTTVAIGSSTFLSLIEKEPSIAKALLIRLSGRLRAAEATR